MSTGRGWVMTPEEKSAALAEAKTRGLPDGWRVELDVSMFCSSFSFITLYIQTQVHQCLCLYYIVYIIVYIIEYF